MWKHEPFQYYCVSKEIVFYWQRFSHRGKLDIYYALVEKTGFFCETNQVSIQTTRQTNNLQLYIDPRYWSNILQRWNKYQGVNCQGMEPDKLKNFSENSLEKQFKNHFLSYYWIIYSSLSLGCTWCTSWAWSWVVAEPALLEQRNCCPGVLASVVQLCVQA